MARRLAQKEKAINKRYKLSPNEKKEWDRLQRLTKGTTIKIRRVGPANVSITRGRGGKPTYKQLGGNVGLSATTMVKATKAVMKRRKRRR